MDENVILVVTNTDGSVNEYEFATIVDYDGRLYAVLTNCNGLRIMEIFDLELPDFRDIRVELAQKVVEIYKEQRRSH